MTDAGWLLIVEQGERWTAAIQSRLRRTTDPRPCVRRRDSLPVLAELDAHAPLFVALEVRSDNVFESLEQLGRLNRLPRVGCAALLSLGPDAAEADRRLLQLAALEAGACLAVESPRAVPPLLTAVGRSLDAARRSADRLLPPHERVWRRLPWQPEPWPVG